MEPYGKKEFIREEQKKIFLAGNSLFLYDEVSEVCDEK